MGPDFSYPEGAVYARGTYIHVQLFHNRQDRLHPVESLFSGFLFRNSQLSKVVSDKSWWYETKPFISYRKKLERLSEHLHARLTIVDGKGAPIKLHQRPQLSVSPVVKPIFTAGIAKESGADFLRSYAEIVEKLPDFKESLPQYLGLLSERERDVFTTLLPLAAFIRRKNQEISLGDLIAEVKHAALHQIAPFLLPGAR